MDRSTEAQLLLRDIGVIAAASQVRAEADFHLWRRRRRGRCAGAHGANLGPGELSCQSGGGPGWIRLATMAPRQLARPSSNEQRSLSRPATNTGAPFLNSSTRCP